MTVSAIQIEEIEPMHFRKMVEQSGPKVLHILYITHIDEGMSAAYRRHNIQPAMAYAAENSMDHRVRFYEHRMYRVEGPYDVETVKRNELGFLQLPDSVIKELTVPVVLVFAGSIDRGSGSIYSGDCSTRLKQRIHDMMR